MLVNMAAAPLSDDAQPAARAEPAGPSPASDEQLARAAQRGDQAGLSALVERHHGPLFGFLYRLTGGDRPLAEDLAQEAFTRMLHRLGQYRPAQPFKPWLYAIAVNAARDHFKRADTRRTHALPPDYDAPGDASPLHAVLADETWRGVAALVRALPHHQREVLLLRYVEDLPLDDIARIAGIPVGTVKSRLSLALARLRAAAEESEV
jgi:RNA polymerase sigma-70 factor (ECF subfamily)